MHNSNCRQRTEVVDVRQFFENLRQLARRHSVIPNRDGITATMADEDDVAICRVILRPQPPQFLLSSKRDQPYEIVGYEQTKVLK